jgi:acyl carrier protein
MNEIRPRLVKCFQTVFPGLPEAEVPAASQASVSAWDSVAAITLANVVEDEFGIQMDYDMLPDLDSFDRVFEYLQKEVV